MTTVEHRQEVKRSILQSIFLLDVLYTLWLSIAILPFYFKFHTILITEKGFVYY